jgi:hypothetical protein
MLHTMQFLLHCKSMNVNRRDVLSKIETEKRVLRKLIAANADSTRIERVEDRIAILEEMI